MEAGVWLVVTFIVLAVLVIIKLANEKQAVALKILIIAFIFVVLSVAYVFMKNGISFTDSEGIITGAKAYFSWLGHVFGNVKNVFGYAVKQEWTANVTQP